MADPFGRPVDPDEPDRDPVDERLRGLARDTESLVVLAGPAAARRRGERRSARHRTAALSAAVALALAVGSWQLLPRLGADPPAAPASGGVSPAVPPKPLTAKLTDELLPASALPMYPKWPWQAIPDESAAKIRGLCPVAQPSAATASAARAYVTNAGQSAVYELYAFADPDHAYVAMQLMAESLQAKCRLALSSDGDPKDPTRPGGYRGERAGATMEAWLNRQGAYLGVLLFFGPGNLPGGESDLVYEAAGSQQCIAGSLNRLATGTSPGDPTATPTTLPSMTLVPPGPPGTTEVPDSSGSSGSGSSWGRTPSPSTSPSRC